MALAPALLLLVATLALILVALWLHYTATSARALPLRGVYVAYVINYAGFFVMLAAEIYLLIVPFNDRCWAIGGLGVYLWEMALLFGFLTLVSQIVTSGLGFWVLRE